MKPLLRFALPVLALWTLPLGAQPRRPGAGSTPPAPVTPLPAAPTQATLHITAALVMPDLTLRPVPMHALEAVAERDTTVRIAIRTGMDGTVAQVLPLGRFVIRSTQPVTLGDSTYRWTVPVDVAAAGGSLDLSNVNATAAVGPKRAVARQVAPEREVFEAAKRAVFRVESGLGHGSGFLAAIPGLPEGLVVTNDHVVANSTTASIYLDSITRVPAVVVVRDREADLAILRLPAGRCATCPRLRLATPSATDPLVVAGDRVLAIGFPLSQEMTLTTGIASSVRDGAIISDVNINHGNSGGPMLSLGGDVIGVNTFGDFTTQGGPGISGAIAITRILPLLAKIPAALTTVGVPADRALPIMPLGSYSSTLMMTVADTFDPKAYRKLLSRNANKFLINMATPVMYRVSMRVAEAEVGRDRKRREARSNVAADEQYSELKQTRD